MSHDEEYIKLLEENAELNRKLECARDKLEYMRGFKRPDECPHREVCKFVRQTLYKNGWMCVGFIIDPTKIDYPEEDHISRCWTKDDDDKIYISAQTVPESLETSQALIEAVLKLSENVAKS